MKQLVSAAYSRERDDGQNEVTFPSHFSPFIRISSGLNYSFWQPLHCFAKRGSVREKCLFPQIKKILSLLELGPNLPYSLGLNHPKSAGKSSMRSLASDDFQNLNQS